MRSRDLRGEKGPVVFKGSQAEGWAKCWGRTMLYSKPVGEERAWAWEMPGLGPEKGTAKLASASLRRITGDCRCSRKQGVAL